jgi:hypothetical protein
MTTDTPRTDAALVDHMPECSEWSQHYLDLSTFARQIERELAASKAEVERLKEAMISCLHITNCYDGNYARACDNVEHIVRNALISLTPDKTNQ